MGSAGHLLRYKDEDFGARSPFSVGLGRINYNRKGVAGSFISV